MKYRASARFDPSFAKQSIREAVGGGLGETHTNLKIEDVKLKKDKEPQSLNLDECILVVAADKAVRQHYGAELVTAVHVDL